MVPVSRRHSAVSSTDFRSYTCFGPRTETRVAGTIWPTTNQSNSIRSAARHCLTLGAATRPGALNARPTGSEYEPAVLAPDEKAPADPRIGAARVRVADVGGEEFHIAPACPFARLGGDRGYELVGRNREWAARPEPGQDRSSSTALLQQGSVRSGLAPAAFVLERAVPPVMKSEEVALGVALLEVQIFRARAGDSARSRPRAPAGQLSLRDSRILRLFAAAGKDWMPAAKRAMCVSPQRKKRGTCSED